MRDTAPVRHPETAGVDEAVLLRLESVAWLPVPNVVESVQGPHPLEPQRLTSAVVFVHNDRGELLLTRVTSRGWDVPGGHLEPGESPGQAALRELAEETGLLLPPAALTAAGYVRVHVTGAHQPGYRYPYPHSYMAAWSAFTRQTRVQPQPASECVQTAWFSLVHAREHLQGGPWWPLAERDLRRSHLR